MPRDHNAYIADGTESGRGTKDGMSFTGRQICCFQFLAVLVFAVGVAGGIVIGIYAYHGGPDGDRSDDKCPVVAPPVLQQTPTKNTDGNGANSNADAGAECPHPDPVSGKRYEETIYAPLTTAEMDKVAKFLLDQGIVSTITTPQSLTDNFILYQFIHPPVKSDALQHLDNGGSKPRRYAKVTVQRGGVSNPDVMEYKVGPLDASTMTSSAITQPGSIHFNSRPYEFIELTIMEAMLAPELAILAPLLAESFDGASYPDDLVLDFYNGPPSTTGTDRDVRWLLTFNGFRAKRDIDLIHILPISGTVHNPGTDITKWRMDDFHYLNQGPYDNASQLMDAYNKDAIKKFKMEHGFRKTIYERVYPKRDTSLPLRENADMHGPRTYYPQGPRYKVDGTHVDWMGWSLDISGGQIRGPALFDIQFRGERVVYELAVNDIALNYAMDSHPQNNIIYADATYGIMGGETPTTVMKGVDCPEHGTVLQTAYWNTVTQTSVNMSSICIFEADAEEALWRHVGFTFEAGLRNRYLVIRVPVVIGNYDYTFEFDFFLDGKIYTYARASGYIQAAFWDKDDPINAAKNNRDPFGYRLSDYMMGPVHDHMFGFKVDMDILEKNNTFQVIKWKAGPQLEALRTQDPSLTKVPEYFIYNETRYIEWEKVRKERGIRDTPEQQFWLVVNERQKNKWGVERGYQIAPLTTGSQSLKTHPLLKALSFTKYHCAVTKRREEEPTLTSIYDVNRMDNPKGHLDKYINDEDIVDEDIVNWVSIGFLHIPTSEDMPMTARVEAGFMLRPFNFFDRTASYDMPQHTETSDHTLTESEPVFDQCTEPKTEYCRFC